MATATEPPGEQAAPAGMLAITRCHAKQNGQRNNSRCERGHGKLIGAPAQAALGQRDQQSKGNRLNNHNSSGVDMRSAVYQQGRLCDAGEVVCHGESSPRRRLSSHMCVDNNVAKAHHTG